MVFSQCYKHYLWNFYPEETHCKHMLSTWNTFRFSFFTYRLKGFCTLLHEADSTEFPGDLVTILLTCTTIFITTVTLLVSCTTCDPPADLHGPCDGLADPPGDLEPFWWSLFGYVPEIHLASHNFTAMWVAMKHKQGADMGTSNKSFYFGQDDLQSGNQGVGFKLHVGNATKAYIIFTLWI